MLKKDSDIPNHAMAKKHLQSAAREIRKAYEHLAKCEDERRVMDSMYKIVSIKGSVQEQIAYFTRREERE